MLPLFLLLSSAAAIALPEPFVMPWLCLERCNDTSADIAAQLNQFAVNSTILNAASFEIFNLGPNSTLVKNNLTQVARPLEKIGVQRWAMLSSYPYPPQFLQWMKEVFANPQPFIAACIQAARENNLSGFNTDWEPTNSNETTPQDALDYAAFLNTFADAMHAEGLGVSVDVAGWSPIWNFTAIAATSVDFIATMSTYTDDDQAFFKSLDYAVATIPKEKLVVGLETVKASNNQPYDDAELAVRFNAIKAKGIRRVGLWRAGIPSNWWSFLQAL